MKLIHNNHQYFHSITTTSMFGGVSTERCKHKVNTKTNVITKLTTEQWNAELEVIGEEMGIELFNNTLWDLEYKDSFIDCR